jgi:hypothetical protein
MVVPHVARQEPDRSAHALLLAHDIVTVEDRGAFGRFHYRGEHAERGGLSRAVGPEQPENLSGFDLEGNVVHRMDGTAFGIHERL